METHILVIGVIRKGEAVLLRKKPAGAPPYKETWYLFGGELTAEHNDPDKVLAEHVKQTTGIDIRATEHLGWDTEIKPNTADGAPTHYVYLDTIAEYVSGELVPGPGIERLEWAPIEKLGTYDLVPPTVKLFKKLGYL